MGLSRVTTFKGLYITDLCEDKIAVHPDVNIEMERLRTIAKLKLCISPLYHITGSCFKLCYLNARSAHEHIQDLCSDLNYSSSDININVFQKQDLVLKMLMTCTASVVTISSEMIILIPVMD